MNFKESFARYRAGTASEEEIAYIEAELEKNELINEYMSEQLIPQFERDDQVVSESLPDTTRLKRAVNRKFVKITSLAVILVILSGLAVQYIALQLYDRMFYNPNEGYENQYGSEQFFVDVSTLTELHFPGYVTNLAMAESLGMGKYDIRINQDNYANRSPYVYTDKLVRGEIPNVVANFYRLPSINTFYDAGEMEITFDDGTGRKYEYQKPEHYQDEVNELAKLPQSSYVSAYVSYKKDLSMDELAALIRRYENIYIPWVVVRTGERGQSRMMTGFDPTGGGIIIEQDMIPTDEYPCLELSYCSKDGGMDYSGEHMSEHFKSLLKHLSSRNDFLIAMGEYTTTPSELYKQKLAYVEEHGVNAYGLLIAGNVSDILNFLQQEQVNSLIVDDVRVSKLSR
ncbi:anti sigma factor C-terminal domain-containing protein [Paenibacillus marinisediminis]